MNRRDAEARRENRLTDAVIGSAIEVHKALGPGLLESAFEQCLCHELSSRGIAFRRQVPLPVTYKEARLDCGYVIDLVGDELAIVELKTVERLLAVHEAQLLTYLRLSDRAVGLLINFNVAALRSGVRRLVNQFED